MSKAASCRHVHKRGQICLGVQLLLICSSLQKLDHTLVFAALDLFWRSRHQDSTFIQDNYLIGDLKGAFQFVSHHNDGHAQSIPKLSESGHPNQQR